MSDNIMCGRCGKRHETIASAMECLCRPPLEQLKASADAFNKLGIKPLSEQLMQESRRAHGFTQQQVKPRPAARKPYRHWTENDYEILRAQRDRGLTFKQIGERWKLSATRVHELYWRAVYINKREDEKLKSQIEEGRINVARLQCYCEALAA